MSLKGGFASGGAGSSDTTSIQSMMKPVAKDRSYTCDGCGETFLSDQGEDAAEVEYQTIFGDDPHLSDERGVLCDDCWQEFWKWMRALAMSSRSP